jgi:hypothetical protein
MFRSLVLRLLLVCAVPLFGENSSSEWLDQARALASEGKHVEAEAIYSKLLGALPTKSDQREVVAAERILSLYALKNYAETEAACGDFLRRYRASPYGFTVSYVLAAAEFGLERYDGALKIFAKFDIQQIRSLETDPRDKIFEVVIRSLEGMERRATSIAFRADAKGLLRGADGNPLLTGSVESIVAKIPSRTELEVFIEQVPSQDDRAKIRALFGDTTITSSVPFVTRYRLGIASFTDTIGGPTFNQFMTQIRGAVELPLTSEATMLGFSGAIDLFGIGSSVAGTQIRTLRWDLYLEGSLFRTEEFLMKLKFGGFFRTSHSSPSAFGFLDNLGLLIVPEVLYLFDERRSLGFSAWYTPVGRLTEPLNEANHLFGVALDFTFPGFGNRQSSLFLEYERVRYQDSADTTIFSMIRVGGGYRVLF